MLLLLVFLSLTNAGDCDNPTSWGCDRINTDEPLEDQCVGILAKKCGLCKSECSGDGAAAEATTKAPEPCDPKPSTCAVCTADMKCDDKLFVVTDYEEGKRGRFGCTWATKDYTYANEHELCPLGTTLIKANAECKSGDTRLGWFSSLDKCAKAAAAQGGRFFIYGTSWKWGQCYIEKMETAECDSGWEDDYFNVYENGLKKELAFARASVTPPPRTFTLEDALIYSFAAIGLGSLLYGAGNHFFATKTHTPISCQEV